MLKVYIADDEEVVRVGLKKIIDWHSLGFEVCGEGSDGMMAYHDILFLQPDLILLDIRMPKKQGLDLAAELRENGYDGRIIILSGYSEFKYAQDAIKCDVDYYLTKPIEEEELQNAVIDIRHTIQKKRLHTEHLNYYQEKAKYKILQDMMISNDSRNLATLDYSLGELNLNADSYQILLLSVDSEVAKGEGFSNAFEDFCTLMRVPKESRTIERLSIRRMDVVVLKGELVIERFNNFMKDAYSSQEGSYCIYAGRIVAGINEIYYSYHDALAISERHFFLDHDQFIMGYEELSKVTIDVRHFTVEDSKDYGKIIYELIQTHNKQGYRDMLLNLRTDLSSASNSVESIKSFLSGMFLYIKQEYKKDYASLNYEFSTNAEVIEHIQGSVYLNQIFEYLQDKLDLMLQFIGNNSSESIVDEIIEYIQFNYHKDIKLKTLAPKFGYNSSYLGKIFSKKKSVSFNDYLHKIRTDKAKELLLNEAYKVYEISEMVGYKNVDYFHLKFRQYMGCTPNEYRLKHNIANQE